jgi:hypothetical protein
MSTQYQNFLKKLKWIDTSTLSFDMKQAGIRGAASKTFGPL